MIPRGATPLSVVFAAVATVCTAIMLYASLSPAIGYRRTTACYSNLKQIGLGISEYAQDYDDMLPRAWYGKDAGLSNTVNYKWMDAIGPYVKTGDVFNCPSDESDKPYIQQSGANYGSYVFNNAYYAAGDKLTPPAGQPLSKIKENMTVLVIDGEKDFQFAWPDPKHAPEMIGTDPPRIGSITARHYGSIAEVPVTLWIDGSVHHYYLQQIAAEKVINGQKVYTGFTIERD